MVTVQQQQTLPVQGGPAVVMSTQPQSGIVQEDDTFPYKSHRETGWLQISLGLAAVLVQIIDIVVVKNLEKDFKAMLTARDPIVSEYPYPFYYYDRTLYIDGQRYQISPKEHSYWQSFSMTYYGTGIWAGLLVILVGAFGAAISRQRKSKRICLRNTYMILSILVAIFVATSIIGNASVEIALANSYSNAGSKRDICPWILCFIGLAEFVMSIIAASICCCCSQVPRSPATGTVTIVMTYTSQPAGYPASLQVPAPVPGIYPYVGNTVLQSGPQSQPQFDHPPPYMP